MTDTANGQFATGDHRSMASALRVQAKTFEPERMDSTDIRMWGDSSSKLLLLAASEIDRLHGRDQANADTIKTLAQMLAQR